MKDKLWFFVSARYFSVNNFIANTFFDDGSQGIDDQFIKSAMARLTWQVSPRNKLSGVLRRDRQVPRPRHAEQRTIRRPRRRWFSPAYHTTSQVDVDRDQPAADRSRLLEQPRVLHQQLPGRHRAAARYRRRGSPTRRGPSSTWAAARPPRPSQTHAEPGALQLQASVVLRHRLAQHQGRLPVPVGRRSCTRSTPTAT